ncbi:MAG: hypothetical protein Fur0021_10760 [Candidatus Promineifilaceae bacterium]
MSDKRLYRSKDERIFLGVAAGVANYLGIDPVFIRAAFVLIALSSMGTGALLYLLLALILPEEADPVAKAQPFDEEEIVVKETA